MTQPQPGILSSLPPLAKYLLFHLQPGLAGTRPAESATLSALPAALAATSWGDAVVGCGNTLVEALGRTVPGLRAFPVFPETTLELPVTPYALLLWLRGDDRGELALRARRIQQQLAPWLECERMIDAFAHGGRDLTGYEDGTENPQGDEAVAAAVVADGPLAGSSFLAWQQWLHQFDRFEQMSKPQQDLAIGRERDSNEEIDDAPDSAHVKRTAQESFDPEAYLLRRSMPWSEGARMGLVFAAFGASLDAFEAQWKRMIGIEDGVCDALFQFTRPLSSACFWCPPLCDGRLDWSALNPG